MATMQWQCSHVDCISSCTVDTGYSTSTHELLLTRYISSTAPCLLRLSEKAAMAASDQIVYHDAFLVTIQSSARVLDPIRFPLVITVNRPGNDNYISTIRNLLQGIYCDRGTINAISQSETKSMIMFTDDQDAIRAYEELHNISVEHQMGVVVNFKIWHLMDDLGYDVADHQMYVSVEGLPLHLWKKEIVEQLLHPYCALEQLSEETQKRRNPSSYAAFAWSQQSIAIPGRISLKVINQAAGDFSGNNKEGSTEVTVYKLFIKAVGYLCDSTTNCSCNLDELNTRYEITYDPDRAQCFLSEIPDNKDLLNELQYGVLATTSNDHHGCQKEEIEGMVSSYLGCSVKVHRLHATQFIILPSNALEGAATKKALLGLKHLDFHSARFILERWTAANMSTIEKLPLRVSVSITEIPAHLCTPKHSKKNHGCSVYQTTVNASERYSLSFKGSKNHPAANRCNHHSNHNWEQSSEVGQSIAPEVRLQRPEAAMKKEPFCTFCHQDPREGDATSASSFDKASLKHFCFR